MLADRYDALLLDLDGVLYRGSTPVPGAGPTLRRLREAGKRIAFVTNNSSRTPTSVAEHLRAIGVDASPEEVETSALTTAAHLASRSVRSAFVVGEEGLRRALIEAGVALLDDEPRSVDAVVVGFDREADWAKLRTASVLVEHGALLIASNADPSYPAPDGDAWPGAGALLAVIETTVGRKAEVVGKPHAPLFIAALARAGGGRPLVVGDRIDTDIAGANALGWDSMLVLTGITTPEEAATSVPRPTYVAEDLTALLDAR
jgi:phosphoglycolate/pyridoxal phosphate phosphatase family enzyme